MKNLQKLLEQSEYTIEIKSISDPGDGSKSFDAFIRDRNGTIMIALERLSLN